MGTSRLFGGAESVHILGWIAVVVAVVWILYKMYISYSSCGGRDFVMPVYDAAVYPPILIAVGLYFALAPLEVSWPIWAYVVIWLGVTALVVGAIRLTEELGDQEL